jgi:CheY-like chemotaxis protein/two-component sensor histidine kinase
MRLQEALKNMTAASNAKSNFLSTMSHEMRTPMNAIIGMTAIGRNAKDIERKDYALGRVEDASAHLLALINDVLDMSKIEANKLELSPVEFSFERMLQKVVSVINFKVDEKRQRFSVSVDKKVPRFIVADDQRLSQVITNLLSNAIKFTPEGGEIMLSAELVSERDGICELKVSVKDNGIGISKEQQERLFRAFGQAESGISRKFGGTGLGLAISKRIVEMMGGGIWVQSEKNKGSAFSFTVKAARGTKKLGSMLRPGINRETLRIMAVDDHSEQIDIIKDIFENLNILCDTAGDGYEACRSIEANGDYDIYFIDLRMPGMDGIELTRWIKTRNTDSASVVIMISGTDWSVIKDAALDAGVDKYIQKPLFSSAIIDCVNELVGVDEAAHKKEAVSECDEPEFSGKRLLLAEDVEINREILISLLEGTGLEIEYAENGVEAVEMVSAAPHKYDLVFMDVQMPVMDGMEATRRIRALPAAAALPIVAMTANVFKDDIEDCLRAGMNDHIGKPLDMEEVYIRLRRYLRGR